MSSLFTLQRFVAAEICMVSELVRRTLERSESLFVLKWTLKPHVLTHFSFRVVRAQSWDGNEALLVFYIYTDCSFIAQHVSSLAWGRNCMACVIKFQQINQHFILLTFVYTSSNQCWLDHSLSRNGHWSPPVAFKCQDWIIWGVWIIHAWGCKVPSK